MIPKSSWCRNCTVWQAHLSFQLFTLGKSHQVCLFHIISTPLCLKTAAKRFPHSQHFGGPKGTHIQNRNIHILQAVPRRKRGKGTREREGFKVSYWGDGASGDNGFIHGADARQKGSFTSVLVHRCNIYIGKGNYAVRHRGKKWTNLPPPPRPLPPRKSQSRSRPKGTVTMVKRTSREVMTLAKGLHCRGTWPEPDTTCLPRGHLQQPGFRGQKPSDIRDPSPTPHVLSKIVYIYSGGQEGRLGCPELCLKIELGGEGKQSARAG